MPKKNRNCPITRKTLHTVPNMAHGVLRCKASDKDNTTVDQRFGKIGKQTIEDTGPLTKKRMETIDDETSAAAIDFMKRQHNDNKTFLLLV